MRVTILGAFMVALGISLCVLFLQSLSGNRNDIKDSTNESGS